jgi:ABC-type transport system involved in multi-copper enzyme maturation permease subunit
MTRLPWRLRRLVRNPVIAKDGLSRVRSWRAPAAMAVYLGLLGLFAYLVFALQLGTSGGTPGFAQVGRTAFTVLAVVQLALVCLFAPAVAAGAISGEQERQTLDVLLVSSMTPFGIVWGKLVASVAFILLLITVALPVFATVFLFGGIDLGQFLISQLLTVMTALTVGAVSLFLSAFLRRTLAATVVAYGLAFAGTAGTLVIGTALTAIVAAQRALGGGAGAADPHPLLLINPVYAMVDALQNLPGGPVPLARIPALLVLSPAGSASGGGPAVEPWVATVVVQAILVVLSVLGAVRVLRGRRVPRSDRWPLESGVELQSR